MSKKYEVITSFKSEKKTEHWDRVSKDQPAAMAKPFDGRNPADALSTFLGVDKDKLKVEKQYSDGDRVTFIGAYLDSYETQSGKVIYVEKSASIVTKEIAGDENA